MRCWAKYINDGGSVIHGRPPACARGGTCSPLKTL